MKCPRMSMQWKILIPFGILILVIIGAFTGYNNSTTSSQLMSLAKDQATQEAQSASLQVNIEALETISAGDENSGAYQNILSMFEKNMRGTDIKYLYILTADADGNLTYLVDSDQEVLQNDEAVVGVAYEGATYDQLKSVFENREKITTDVDKDNMVTAYVPILDGSRTVAVLGCDYDATGILNNLHGQTVHMILFGLVALIASLVISYLLVHRFVRQMRTVNNKLYDLVHNEGDLTQTLDIHSGDEFEIIADNVNAMLSYIRRIMINISNNSVDLTHTSNLVSNEIGDAQQGISDVSATMEQMSAAMEETSASLQQINENIHTIDQQIEQISTQALDGQKTTEQIQQRAKGMEEAAMAEKADAVERVAEMAENVQQKIEDSKSVEQINILTDNIISITEETNLLSLNASIEAARAGEAGRGFAVVANEIGNLAQNSAQAASEIQEVSKQVVDTVNALATEAEEMIKFMNETAVSGYEKLLDTSKDYQENAANLNSVLTGFAHASEELRSGINFIKDAVDGVNNAVEESANGITNVTTVSVDMVTSMEKIGGQANDNRQIAENLNGEVSQFKL